MFKKHINPDEEAELKARLAKKLEKLDAAVVPPGRLTPVNIIQNLEAGPKHVAKNRRGILRYAAAMAACFVLVAVSAAAWQKQTPIRNDLSTGSATAAASGGIVAVAKTYDELTEAFQTMYKNNPATLAANYSDTAEKSVDEATPQENQGYMGLGASVNTAKLQNNAGSEDYSTTNQQVAGIDEGDILKNDGSYLYTLLDGKVEIIDIRDPKNMKLVSTLSFGSQPEELYIYKNSLVVILDQYDKAVVSKSGASQNNAVTTNGVRTTADVYDVSNRSKPVLKRSFSQDGSYISSRLIGNMLYLASDYYIYLASGTFSSDQIVPKAGSGSGYGILPADSIYIPKDPQSTSYAVLSGINVENSSQTAVTKACVGAGNSVYASADNFYIASSQYSGVTAVNMPDITNGTNAKSPAIIQGGKGVYAYGAGSKTNIIRFKMSGSTVAYTGSCSVNGSLLNQFSMDENSDNFRIATTSYSGGTMQNNVYVYDKDMKLIGSLENLAPGEKMYSVRFMDKKAYIVTYRTVDPLFAIDLSVPSAPKVLGELKIPGFSDYLQPYSDNLIIGFGKNAVQSGDMAFYQGLKLSLFDVSDPLSPKELFSYNLGERGSDSQVLYDHRALLFSSERNIIGIPVTIKELPDGAQNDVSAYGSFKFNGYYVFGLDMSKGFVYKGRVTHMSAGDDESTMYSKGLQILRGAYSGNTLFTISNSEVVASSLNDFTKLGALKLPFSSAAGTGGGAVKGPDAGAQTGAGSAVSGSSGQAVQTPAK